MKHKHYDCIVAWAAGEKIEYLDRKGNWRVAPNPCWDELFEYRVKKEPVVTVKYFHETYDEENELPSYKQFHPDLEKWDLKITYHDDVAVKVELPS